MYSTVQIIRVKAWGFYFEKGNKSLTNKQSIKQNYGEIKF